MRKVLIIAMALLLTSCGEYGDGERIGTIQKFSRKGLFNKTWEGELLLGGLRKKTQYHTDSDGKTSTSTSMVANVWHFTVEDPVLIARIQKLMETGNTVRARYRQEIITSPLRTDTGIFFPYFLVSMEELK